MPFQIRTYLLKGYYAPNVHSRLAVMKMNASLFCRLTTVFFKSERRRYLCELYKSILKILIFICEIIKFICAIHYIGLTCKYISRMKSAALSVMKKKLGGVHYPRSSHWHNLPYVFFSKPFNLKLNANLIKTS